MILRNSPGANRTRIPIPSMIEGIKVVVGLPSCPRLLDSDVTPWTSGLGRARTPRRRPRMSASGQSRRAGLSARRLFAESRRKTRHLDRAGPCNSVSQRGDRPWKMTLRPEHGRSHLRSGRDTLQCPTSSSRQPRCPLMYSRVDGQGVALGFKDVCRRSD